VTRHRPGHTKRMPPKRGKVLNFGPAVVASSGSPSASSKPGQPRGKFLGQPSTGTAASSNSVGDEGSLEAIRSHVHTARIAASSRRKAISLQRGRVFKDLEEAEGIALSLLECASEAAGALSDMTSARTKEKYEESLESKSDEPSFEELASQVRRNGSGYLKGVTKIHSLLAPHSSLVKVYKNHNRPESQEDVAKKPQGSLASTVGGGTDSVSKKVVEQATKNMYAARVAHRLAVERSEILKEMLQMEESERESASNETTCDPGENDGDKKRKHGSEEKPC